MRCPTGGYRPQRVNGSSQISRCDPLLWLPDNKRLMSNDAIIRKKLNIFAVDWVLIFKAKFCNYFISTFVYCFVASVQKPYKFSNETTLYIWIEFRFLCCSISYDYYICHSKLLVFWWKRQLNTRFYWK